MYISETRNFRFEFNRYKMFQFHVSSKNLLKINTTQPGMKITVNFRIGIEKFKYISLFKQESLPLLVDKTISFTFEFRRLRLGVNTQIFQVISLICCPF